ncbi:hypothetical protein QZH41_003881 [Actinostola sp. cb2023]|nr:hypothetical protein QZH41_003881 [Actinostola sp. cb2023]
MQNLPEEENNGFGPIFKRRGSSSKWVSFVILLVFVALVFAFETERYSEQQWLAFYCVGFGFSLLALMLGDLIRRLCLFVEEFRHRRSRYGGSVKKAFNTSFDCLNIQFIGLMAAMAIILAAWYTFYQDDKKSSKIQLALFWLNAIFVPTFAFLFGLGEPSKVEYSQVNEKENKNLADGLAWSFYFGYLKFVLPELKNQIGLTADFRHKIIVQKLFLIIPKNCQIFDKISNSGPKMLVEKVGNLVPLKRNRGGIHDREYKHTVYRIVDERTKEEHFCVMEYATPLINLHDMSNDPRAGLSREERDSQVNLFVSKLKNILDEDIECRGKCKLITLGGDDQDIGKIMISALKDSALEIDK